MHFIAEGTKGTTAWAPFPAGLAFLRAALLGWRGLGAGTLLDLAGPEGKVRWVRVYPGPALAWGAVQLGRIFSPKRNPIRPHRTDAQRLLKPGSMPFPTRKKENPW